MFIIFRKNSCLSWPACWTPCASLVTHLSLNALLSSLLKINGKEFLLTPFSVQTLTCWKTMLKLFFFQYKTEFIRYSSPLNQTNRFHQLIIVGLVLPASLYSQSIKRVIMIKFSHRWNILRGLRKHERYVMHGWMNCCTLIPASTRFV